VTHYETLEVGPEATAEEIKAAYKRLTFAYHPDRVPDHLTDLRRDAEERFKKITEAFSVLSDRQKRARYDAELGRHQDRETREKAENRWRAEEEARKRAEDEALQEALRRYHQNAAEKTRQRRLKALERKKRLLIASGIAAVLLVVSPLLIAAGLWAQKTGLRGWWRASGVIADTDKWWVEDLRLYKADDGETEAVPGAVVTLRGYVKGLPGCYVIPARGAVVSEDGNRVTIRVEMQRLGAWNKKRSYMGTCTPNFAPIEAPLVGNINVWEAIDLIAVDTDAKLERVFSEAQVQWNLKR